MKVIVVDDESDALANFLVSVVDDGFLEYKMFKSEPLAALDYTRKNQIDAAFLDINMPEINGVDLAKRLMQIKPNIKIVFISGYTQDENTIKKQLGGNLCGFCYKPYSIDRLFGFIKQLAAETGNNRVISIRTFGGFDLFIDNTPIMFTSTKSKELLALLVEKNGAVLTMGEAMSFLWPDKNAELAKIIYRDAVWRLRQTLNEFFLDNLIIFFRAQSAINKTAVQCDYWDFLEGINKEKYSGSYMPGYDWSIETQSRLDILSEKHP